MTKDVKLWTRECSTCQKCKSETVAKLGLLQPLPILDRAWSSISMDFIKGLPKSKGKIVILVVVDRLTKFGHFLALAHPYIVVTVAQTCMGCLTQSFQIGTKFLLAIFFRTYSRGWGLKCTCQ